MKTITVKSLQCRAITVKYLCATNTRGSRLVAKDEEGHKVILNKDLSLSNDDAYKEAAIALCNKMGWKGTLAGGWAKDGAVFVFVD